MDLLLAGDHEVLEELRNQYKYSNVLSRKYTGVGFFLNLSIPTSNKKINEIYKVKDRIIISDLGGIGGLPKVEAGFILWIDDGYIDCLEGYTYGDDKWPEAVKHFKFYYFGKGDRNLHKLVEAWRI